MIPEPTPGVNDQSDMKGTSMDDLPGADGSDTDVNVDVDIEEDKKAEALEDAQEDAAERRKEEGGYQ